MSTKTKKGMRLLALMLVAIMTVMAFTACGGGSDSGSEESSDSGSSGASQVWKVAAMGSEQNTITQGWYIFEEEVEKALPNVDVQVFPNGQLGTATDQLVGGLQNNTIQFMDISVGNVAQFSNAFLPLDAPFLFKDRDTAIATVDGDAGKAMAEQYLNDTDIKLLGYWDYGFRQVTNSKKEIKGLADFKGLKIRTLSSPIYLDMLTKLGANPSTMAYGEVFTGLQQGTIDGQENPMTSIVDAKFNEVQKYLTKTEHIYGFLGLHMSNSLYESLSDDEKAALEQAAATAIQKQRDINAEAEVAAEKTLNESGLTITELDDAAKDEMREATASIWDDIEKQCGKELFDQVKAAAGV